VPSHAVWPRRRASTSMSACRYVHSTMTVAHCCRSPVGSSSASVVVSHRNASSGTSVSTDTLSPRSRAALTLRAVALSSPGTSNDAGSRLRFSATTYLTTRHRHEQRDVTMAKEAPATASDE
jgi:hypothetical protein